MVRRLLIGLLAGPLVLVVTMAGCDPAASTSTAPEGHSGMGPGHEGVTPAGGLNSPVAKKAALKR